MTHNHEANIVAYRLGFTAGREGKPKEANPYLRDRLKQYAWDDGWAEGVLFQRKEDSGKTTD